MKTTLDCIPCFIRQALDASRFATKDTAIQEQIIKKTLKDVIDLDLSQSPPLIAQKIHRKLREASNTPDPYKEVKDRFNALALEMIPDLKTKIATASNPFHTSVRLAVAGNVIDFGANSDLTEEGTRTIINQTMDEPFFGDIENLRLAINAANNILYLTDNCGEIVFDRLLIEQMEVNKITVAVRGNPVLNDATYEDAKLAGICDLVEVIDNGSDAPATILSDCSKEFQNKFNNADLIISKGQGNYESLSLEEHNIYFLFKAKCQVVADIVGLPKGTHIASKQSSLPAATNEN